MIQRLSYAECDKGGLHTGELMNFTCIEKECCDQSKSIGCSVCMEQDHSNCRKAPLKSLCQQLIELVESHKNCSSHTSQQQMSSSNSTAFGNSNSDNSFDQLQQNLLNLILSNRQQILESVMVSTNALIDKTRNVQRLCIGIFDNIEQQVKQKMTMDNEIEGIVEKIVNSMNAVSNLQSLLNQAFKIINPDDIQYTQHTPSAATTSSSSAASTKPTAASNGKPDTTAAKTLSIATTSTTKNNKPRDIADNTKDMQNLHENLTELFSSLSTSISQKNGLILAQLNLQEKYLSDLQSDQQLVMFLRNKKKLNLSFSQVDKHSAVSIIKPNVVKSNSGSSSNYKFALANSSLPMNQPTTFAFKMQNIQSSNWIAIGVALQSVIKSKNYSFSLSLGHGAYMISSNSGSWSHSEATFNNVVKSFDFASSSIIECTFNPIEGYISYQLKDNPAKKYKLNISLSNPNENQFHPCVLFYYPNDEVELIYPYP